MRCLVSVARWLRDYPLRDSGALIVWWTAWHKLPLIRWIHVGYKAADGIIHHYGPVEYKYCYIPPLWFQGRWYKGDYQQMSRLMQAGMKQYP